MRDALLLLAAGIVLRVASAGAPPILIPLALAAAFFALHGRAPREWAIGGGVVGLVYASALLVALAKWGPWVALGLWAAVSLAFAAFFLVLGLATNASPAALAGAWCAMIFALDRFVYAPVLLTAPLALAHGAVRALLGAAGAPVVEGLVVLAAASAAHALHSKRWRDLWGAAVLPASLALASLSARPEREGDAVLHAVQPSFTWEDYAARGWSIEARHHLEGTLDALTARAVKRGPGTVIWPENGTGLPDAQLARRRTRLEGILRGSGADLLVSGLQLEGGRQHVGAVLLDEHGAGGRTLKSKLVPLAEADVQPGPTAILDARAGKLGVSICYDVLFGDHVRGLVERGAELLVVTGDDASFGTSLIAEWHVAHAVARAAEVRRSLLFTANHGPSVSFDVASNQVAHLAGPVSTVTLSKTRAAAPSWLPTLAVLLGLLSRPKRRRSPPLSRAAVAAALLAGVVVEIAHVAIARGIAPSLVVRDAVGRGLGARGVNVLPSHFVQSASRTCGRAALAYALTLLGDEVFEEDLAAQLPVGREGSTLADLTDAARQRGFEATPLAARAVEDLPLGAGSVAILHLAPSHFVAATRHEGSVLIFDPGTGRVRPFDPAAGWSGHALVLRHAPVPYVRALSLR